VIAASLRRQIVENNDTILYSLSVDWSNPRLPGRYGDFDAGRNTVHLSQSPADPETQSGGAKLRKANKIWTHAGSIKTGTRLMARWKRRRWHCVP